MTFRLGFDRCWFMEHDAERIVQNWIIRASWQNGTSGA
jgi:hypothetical protein